MKKDFKYMIRWMGILLFILYVLLLVYFLFFSEEYGRTVQMEQGYRYNLIPFAEIQRFWKYRELLGQYAFLSNIMGNVLAFLPFGLILPVIFRGMRSGFLIILSGFGLSLCVETIQLVTMVGCFDVDDLILNTFGAAVGYLIFAVCDYQRRKYYGKKI
ncbi:VanZ family protein [Blautia sp. HCP3S3_G3]|uniref:VanZ family protein n=1 Tax=Blautia sp. HCP3S3_G3 TaxID=3438913 RepID=UPI003F8CDF4B